MTTPEIIQQTAEIFTHTHTPASHLTLLLPLTSRWAVIGLIAQIYRVNEAVDLSEESESPRPHEKDSANPLKKVSVCVGV